MGLPTLLLFGGSHIGHIPVALATTGRINPIYPFLGSDVCRGILHFLPQCSLSSLEFGTRHYYLGISPTRSHSCHHLSLGFVLHELFSSTSVMSALLPAAYRNTSPYRQVFLFPFGALRYYLQRTRTHHRTKRRLFISVYESYDRDIIKDTIFSLDSYYNTTDLQKLDLQLPTGPVKAHEVRAVSASLALVRGVFHDQDYGSGILEEPRYIFTLLLAGCSCTSSGWILRYRQHAPGSGCYRITARISHIMLLWFDRQVLFTVGCYHPMVYLPVLQLLCFFYMVV